MYVQNRIAYLWSVLLDSLTTQCVELKVILGVITPSGGTGDMAGKHFTRSGES